jgi:peptidoglycan/LPS O-acetylase OafA/YrhL
MNKEINWINWAKIYGMLLVYLYHTSYYLHLPDSGYNFYGPFFVNVFLFISGYLIFRKQLSTPVIDIPKKTWTQGEGRTMLSNILFRIALPTVIFSTINFFPKKILRGEEIDLWSFAHDTILGGSLWFTCTLTVAELLIFLLLLSRWRSIWFYVAYAFCIATAGAFIMQICATADISLSVPWHYTQGMVAVLYLTLGGLYWKAEQRIDHILRGSRWAMLFIVYLVVMFLTVNFAWQDFIFETLFSDLILNTTGVLMLIYVSKQFAASDFVNKLATLSIGLYFLSGAVPNILAVAWTKVFGEAESAAWLMLTVCSFAVSACAVWLIKRYIPWLFDLRLLKKDGNRRNMVHSK